MASMADSSAITGWVSAASCAVSAAAAVFSAYTLQKKLQKISDYFANSSVKLGFFPLYLGFRLLKH
jgi:hypothetical protein